MTLDLLPGFAEGTAATNRRLADDVARVPEAGDVRQAVRWTLAQATAVTELWEYAKDALRSPQVKDDAVQALTLVNAAAASWLALADGLARRLLGSDAAASAETTAAVQRLEAREAEIREAFDTMQRWQAGCSGGGRSTRLAWSRRPRKPRAAAGFRSRRSATDWPAGRGDGTPMTYLVHTLPVVESYLAAIADVPRDVVLEMLAEVEHLLSEKADFYLERFPLGHESYRF